MTVIEPCVDTVVASHKLKTSRPCLPPRKANPPHAWEHAFEPDPGGCSNHL